MTDKTARLFHDRTGRLRHNSIYADVVPEIGECQRQLMMGAEFCYDAIANPKNYDMLRISNKSYTYTSDNQYALL